MTPKGAVVVVKSSVSWSGLFNSSASDVVGASSRVGRDVGRKSRSTMTARSDGPCRCKLFASSLTDAHENTALQC